MAEYFREVIITNFLETIILTAKSYILVVSDRTYINHVTCLWVEIHHTTFKIHRVASVKRLYSTILEHFRVPKTENHQANILTLMAWGAIQQFFSSLKEGGDKTARSTTWGCGGIRKSITRWFILLHFYIFLIIWL